jgi:hypothetical protein
VTIEALFMVQAVILAARPYSIKHAYACHTWQWYQLLQDQSLMAVGEAAPTPAMSAAAPWMHVKTVSVHAR